MAKYDEDVLNLVAESNGEISRSILCLKFRISEPTASRWLDDMVSRKLIMRSGGGRGTRYSIDPADAYIRKKQLSGDVTPIPYDEYRLDAYVNGVSSFFTKEQKEALVKAGQMPNGMTHSDYLTSINRKLLVEASWASSALEGNTYSLIDTEELFDFGNQKGGAKHEEAMMLLNHKHAIEYILENINEICVTRRDVINIHALLSSGLLKNPEDEGNLRRRAVMIGQSTYTPIDVPSILKEQFEKLIDRANEIKDVFDKSFYLLINIAYLQPFIDVNKRTSRLTCNIPLLKAGMIPMSFFQMSRTGYEKGIVHYYETGDFRRIASEFVSCYQISAARFREVMEVKPLPEHIRLVGLHRKEIRSAVRSAVLNKVPLDEAIEVEFGNKKLEPEQMEFIVSYIEKSVNGLSEGNLILYGLTEGDLAAFKKKTSMSP